MPPDQAPRRRPRAEVSRVGSGRAGPPPRPRPGNAGRGSPRRRGPDPTARGGRSRARAGRRPPSRAGWWTWAVSALVKLGGRPGDRPGVLLAQRLRRPAQRRGDGRPVVALLTHLDQPPLVR